MRKDHFTDEALAAAKALARLDYAEEASVEALDFARCQRPDGSFYGTAGQCRTGTPAGAKQEEKSKVIQAPGADPAVMRRKELEEEKRMARMRATNERADAREKARKETKEEREGGAAATLKRIADRGPETKVKKESYSWGDLVTVSKGNEFKAVLHPEHQDALKKLKDGEKTTFTDEQRVKWNAARTGDNLELKSGSKSLSMPVSTLNTEAARSPKAGQKMPGLPQRRPEEDVRRPGGKLIGTSPRNMSIDGLKELKKEAADFRKKFGSRANEEKIAKVFKVYEDRIAAQEKFIKDKYGDER
jgi:hypothetical protein